MLIQYKAAKHILLHPKGYMHVRYFILAENFTPAAFIFFSKENKQAIIHVVIDYYYYYIFYISGI